MAAAGELVGVEAGRDDAGAIDHQQVARAEIIADFVEAAVGEGVGRAVEDKQAGTITRVGGGLGD